MKTTKVVGLVIAALFAASAPAHSGTRFGDWNLECRMSYCESYVRNEPANIFQLECNEDDQDHLDGATLSLSIKGKKPTPGNVAVTIDGKKMEFSVDNNGYNGTETRSDADEFTRLQKALLSTKSRKMHVRFPNGDTASFSLRGVKRVLSGDECWASFYGLKEHPRNGKQAP